MPNTSSIVPSDAELRFWLKVLRGGIGTIEPGPVGAGGAAASLFGAAIFFEATFAFLAIAASLRWILPRTRKILHRVRHNHCDSFAYFLSL
jgi:hypothetical protein